MIKGGCNCGATEWEAQGEGLVDTFYCYCKDCQQAHGSICTEVAVLGAAAFKWTKGEKDLQAYERGVGRDAKEGGMSNNRRWCKNLKCTPHENLTLTLPLPLTPTLFTDPNPAHQP